MPVLNIYSWYFASYQKHEIIKGESRKRTTVKNFNLIATNNMATKM